MLNISKVYIIFVVLSSVYSLPLEGWREISIELRRAVGSAYTAAKHLQVTFISMLKAYEKMNTGPNKDYYLVSFIADCNDGNRKECQAFVLWRFNPTFERKVTSARCRPVSQPEY
ncbi:insoluble matrix shell protein 2-like [Mercenaria mercenaria]|uniref:insoluble matrix shell protein 2-like n=1 Tax=Mercenaria mercenaria TaxID=6596 RepID=UPI00234ED022|nr:insoluble matrix shell protein 2-like [Mercenaria mercenaria]